MVNGAFSMVGRTFLLCYAIWEDEADDGPNEEWFRNLMEGLEPLSTGHYIAETDLPADPSRSTRSFGPASWERLSELRARHDPQGLFHSYLGLA